MADRTRHGFRVAVCQFAESYRPRRNGMMIRRYIRQAADAGADVVHFHECALSGYGRGIARNDFDWLALSDETAKVAETARQCGIWVVLGSSHQLTGTKKPHNSLYLIDPQGRVVDRYDKRFCTDGDLKYYSPGNACRVFEIQGVRCSMLICYDIRFPELYRELVRKQVTFVFHSFHNAHGKGPGIWGDIMPQTLQAHAGINHMWISAPNSSAPYCQWGSVFINPDGRIAGRLPRHRAGWMMHDVNPRMDFYDASGPYRQRAMRGVLHSGRPVNDPRSKNRRCL